MLKKTLIAIILLMALATPLYADGITVFIDGGRLTLDVPPQIMNGRVMVPMRAIFEAMGASVA